MPLEEIGKHARIVIVDDEALICWSLSQRLERAGYKVATAEDAATALILLRKHSTALLITDFKLDGVSGAELICQVRAEFPGLPVIVITAYRTPQLESELRELAVAAIFDKPFDTQQLIQQVKALVPPSRSASP